MKRTKAQLEQELLVANEKLARQERNGVLFTEMALKQSQSQNKDIARQKKKTKKREHRLKNVYDLAMVLRTSEDKDNLDEASWNRILNTIIRLASGR